MRYIPPGARASRKAAAQLAKSSRIISRDKEKLNSTDTTMNEAAVLQEESWENLSDNMIEVGPIFVIFYTN
jgi:hypothetical protein